SPALPEMEFEMGKGLWRAYEREGFIPDPAASGKPSAALAHLERFLPGGPYAAFGSAGHACVFYAKGLLTQQKADEAKAILVSQIQTGKPSAKGSAFKALVLLRDALPIDDAELASLEQTVRGSIASRKADNRIEDEFLEILAAANDPSAGLSHYFGRIRLELESAAELNHLLQSDLAVPRFWAAARAGEAYLAQCPAAPAGEELERWARVRLSLAVVYFFLGNTRKSLEFSEFLLPYRDNPAPLVSRSAVKAGLFWNQSREKLKVADKDQVDADLTALLGTGQCRAEDVYWIFTTLAKHARERGDTALEYLYWRDMRDRMYDFSYTLAPARRTAALEERRPELAQTPPDVRSPANDAMEAAGLAVADPSELPKSLKTGRKAARSAALKVQSDSPRENPPKYYKTFVLGTEESDEMP
ncbi:MAG: hypothetical protein NTW86_25085, partial [Candidatus Sumerlaeota bacterium]|nr:hypothetical protein [Candidatus Sumerlaeota bacterium]